MDCLRNGCKGAIEDGFCVECGLAPAAGGTTRTGTVGSGPVSGPVSGAVSTGSRGRTRGTHGLGAGFVSLPSLPSQDPLKTVLEKPCVPEKRRLCGSCHTKLMRESGFCPQCGKPYSFEPKLRAGDVVAAQYEVRGPIAFGGMGWVYLAQDRKLKHRWCVLKGLLDTKDATSAAAALAEREFLSAVKHPQIVGIYNFVTHGPESYIVMEHVAGLSLADVRKQRGPLPVAEAIAYTHRVLAAFAYLHANGMVYCDFKPANVMLEGDDVKLIDLGGVRKLGDTAGEVYGTKGFFAPEIGSGGAPTVASDLYTVARTLAVLVADFEIQGGHQFSIPQDEPVFAQNDSLRRFLTKATHARPERRFDSAEAMAEQLLGVLRDVVAASGEEPRRSVDSSFFGGDAFEPETPRALPDLRVDSDDPAADELIRVLMGPRARRLHGLEALLAKQPTLEVRLRLVAELTRDRRLADAEGHLAEAEKGRPDWRIAWCHGVLALARGHADGARVAFERVRDELPGELAPRLALGLAAEAEKKLPEAIELFGAVARADRSFVTASFALGRVLLAAGERERALEAWLRVPPSSAARPVAMELVARTALEGADLTAAFRAAEAITELPASTLVAHDLRSRVFATAAARLEAGWRSSEKRLLGELLFPRVQRLAAEREARAAARHAEEPALARALVDRANVDRPWTLI